MAAAGGEGPAGQCWLAAFKHPPVWLQSRGLRCPAPGPPLQVALHMAPLGACLCCLRIACLLYIRPIFLPYTAFIPASSYVSSGLSWGRPLQCLMLAAMMLLYCTGRVNHCRSIGLRPLATTEVFLATALCEPTTHQLQLSWLLNMVHASMAAWHCGIT